MKIESKEKIKKCFDWKSIVVLYLISSIIALVLISNSDTLFSNFIVKSIFYSLPFFSALLTIYGVIGAILMTVLKAEDKKIVHSKRAALIGIIMLLLWIVI